MSQDDGNDPLQTFVQNAARRSDAAFHCMPFICNFDPSEPGLTFFSPSVFQKCDKCSREFCSPMNYRRHIRTHLRSLKVNKESHKNRDLLGAFWDKISLEEAGNLVSFDDISIMGISGSSIVNALASSLHMPVVLLLPQLYRMAGTTLLDMIQVKSSRLPISSQDLFSILDDASENTFLCAGTAESVHRFVIEAGPKEVYQWRNLIASTSLLFEQKLVKAWLAKLEAEALRFQQILVEEEEVTQKRQAQTLERKKKKNIRKKEQKRVCNVGEKTDIIAESLDNNSNFIEGPALVETSTLRHFDQLKAEQKQGPMNTVANVGKVWVRKSKTTTDVGSSRASLTNIPAKGGVGVVSSRTTLQHTVEKSENDVASWKNIVTKGAGSVGSSRTILKNVAVRSAIDVANSEATWKNTVTKGADGAENSRTIVENVVAKTGNDVVSSEASWKNIVTKGADDVGSSRTILGNTVAKSENDVVSSEASWKNIATKGADGAESSRTILENVVAKNANDVASAKASEKTIVAKGADGVGSSRTILKNVVAKSKNDVEISEDSWKNIVTKGADIVENDVASSRTILENIVAKSANDVASSEASWDTIATECADGEGSSRTILDNVVSKSENDVSSSEARLKNIVTKGADDVESSSTILKNVVVESENDVESSRASLQNMVAEGAVIAESSRTILQNVVVKGENDVESARANLHNIVAKSEKNVESSRTSLHNDLYIGSISVAVRNSMLEQHASPNSSNKCEKSDSVPEEQGPGIAMSRDVFDFEKRCDLPVQQGNQSCGKNAMLDTVEDQVVTSLPQSVSNQNDNNLYKERNVQPQGSAYSSFDARAFLAQRWKDAITSDHVKLVLSPEPPCEADDRKVYKLADTETLVSSSKKIDRENSKQARKGKGQP